MTIKEAMVHYNLSERSIRAKLANGILVGEKVTVPTGGLMWNNIREFKSTLPINTVVSQMPETQKDNFVKAVTGEISFNEKFCRLVREHEARKAETENLLKVSPDKNKVIAELFLQDKITYEQLKEMLGMTPKVAENGLIKADEHNWIFIGDLHEPFTDPRYFDFILNIVNKYKIDKVVFMGDEIDNHASSYHESDPNGMSARDELYKAKENLAKWHSAFPNATVIEGNHSRIAKRKMFSAGVAEDWLRSYNDVLGVPTWNYTPRLITDNFDLSHGDTGGRMEVAVQHSGKSQIRGHKHSESYLKFLSEYVFVLQVGCGVKKDAYACGYMGRGAERQIHSAGTYIEGNPGLLTMK